MKRNLRVDEKFGKAQFRRADIFADIRGYTYEQYRAKNMPVKFVQGTVAVSKNGVLRGLHGDFKTWKLVTVLFGEIFYVCVDVRKHSPTYLQYAYVEDMVWSEQVLVPPGFVHGYYVKSKSALFHYEVSRYYDADKQMTIRYDEPKFDIKWPFAKDFTPILSQRDKVTKFNGMIKEL